MRRMGFNAFLKKCGGQWKLQVRGVSKRDSNKRNNGGEGRCMERGEGRWMERGEGNRDKDRGRREGWR